MTTARTLLGQSDASYGYACQAAIALLLCVDTLFGILQLMTSHCERESSRSASAQRVTEQNVENWVRTLYRTFSLYSTLSTRLRRKYIHENAVFVVLSILQLELHVRQAFCAP